MVITVGVYGVRVICIHLEIPLDNLVKCEKAYEYGRIYLEIRLLPHHSNVFVKGKQFFFFFFLLFKFLISFRTPE